MTPLSTTVTGEDEIRQLREALRGALGVSRDALPQDVDPGWRRGWPAVAELGITGLCVPETHGGFGLHAAAAVAAAGELGAALHPAPFAGLTAAAYALGKLAEVAGSDPASTLLEGMLDGSLACLFGRLAGDGSTARLVDGGADADALLLVDVSGELVLFADPAGWKADSGRHGFDVSRACADVVVDPACGRQLPAGESAATAEVLFHLLLCADSVGGLRRVLDTTVAYAAGRQAFGRPIAGFQAVQHRLVDHAVRARGMELLLADAARSIGQGAAASARAVALAEVSVSQSAARLIHDLLQLTGAIGFTWEYGLHFFDRRAHHNARLAANPRTAVARLAAIEGWLDGR